MREVSNIRAAHGGHSSKRQKESVERGDHPFLQLDLIEENREHSSKRQRESVARGDQPFLQSDLIE